ncbi:MAG TPA: translation initiation factor IF-3 [Acidimicrobiales bacterium]|nr:translation initiation factor IF-3 [Acidimicrobiales bacterium]
MSLIAPAPDSNEHRINDRIRAREVRLVDPDGVQLGIKPLPEALTIARQLDLDLVEVAPNANPPVARIMDFGKFKFDEAQRAKESRRKATSSSIKEMKYRPKIGVGDFDTKTRQVSKFLGEGHKVKITIMFRGREMSHPELGKKLLDQVAEQVGPIAKIEAAPKLDGRNMIMVLAPDRRSGPPQSAPAARAGARPATKPPTESPSAGRIPPPPTATSATPAPEEPSAAPTTSPTATSPATSAAPATPAAPVPATPVPVPETLEAPAPVPAADPAPVPATEATPATPAGSTATPPPNGRVTGSPAPTTGAASASGPADER